MSDEIVSFKKKSRKNIRPRKAEEDEDEVTQEDQDLSEKVELYKELRKMREKPHGVSVVTLALGKKTNKEEEMATNALDPFNSNTGGMVDMAVLNSGKYQMKDDAYDTGIGTQFSAETNARDEDAEMLKFIDNKLNEYKRSTMTRKSNEGEGVPNQAKFLSPEEAALLAIPEHLRKSTSSSSRSEEMLSNSMLSGIPEVDLGIEVKIKNIEATEEAKQKIMRDRMSKKEGPSVFVPKKMYFINLSENKAVNFAANRFNIEEGTGISAVKRPRKEKEPPEKPKKIVVVGQIPELESTGACGDKEKSTDKATDDFHFEKFKKQFRRF